MLRLIFQLPAFALSRADEQNQEETTSLFLLTLALRAGIHYISARVLMDVT